MYVIIFLHECFLIIIVYIKSYHRCEQCVELINPSETKICQLDNAVSSDEQILRLQIPMDYSMTMQKVNTAQYLPYDVLQGVHEIKAKSI